MLLLVQSDVDDYAAVVHEVARVVVPGGVIVHVGVHPCFVGHHVESVTRSEDRPTLVSGYRDATWVLEHENFGPGVRAGSVRATCRSPNLSTRLRLPD